jgi:hypothetical protein
MAGMSPAPARLDTDWMTGIALGDWLMTGLAADAMPFH